MMRASHIETRVDRFGRVVLPKGIRDRLDLQAGATLSIEDRDGAVLLRPIRGEPDLVRVDGVLVARGRATGAVADAVRAHREDRVRRRSRIS